MDTGSSRDIQTSRSSDQGGFSIRTMSAVLSLLFCLLLLDICGSIEGLEITAEPGKNVTVKPGDDVILTCRASHTSTVFVLEWSRDDLDEKKVFVYKDGRPFPAAQQESFRKRVFLKNNQMKGGDLSVVLKNVTVNDNGTYECRVLKRTKRSILHSPPISTISLHVSPLSPPPPPGEGGKQSGDDAGQEDGDSHRLRGLIVLPVLAVLVVLLTGVFGLWIFKKKTASNQSSEKQQNPEQDLLNSGCEAQNNPC
ncbi:hypothetical protein OJAV_G00185800 [Oryzias javanicus]|uniref:Ig-like domain-containing protein n=1 Tax=Oryzias javanicus TaxID=123683 RepID=A0A3S2LTN3_ORYJA|nr:hypothetical protein OJAV_G00185800 [Oryzias javanicus]